MLGRATGAALVGVDARLVEVEVDLSGGLPSISAVGLPDASVREGIDRIRAALPHAGFRLPQDRIIVNLAPAEVRKEGAGLDLPIAIALLVADRQIPERFGTSAVLTGELALDGTLRPVRGALAIAAAAREAGRRRVVVPRRNEDEASLVEGIEVAGAATLADVVALARGTPHASRSPLDAAAMLAHGAEVDGPDLADVRGQRLALRALEVAAAGGHNLLLSGPPGAGKTMLARRLPGILPPLGVEEALEVTRVWSAAGLAHGLVARRPFRAPHHGISAAGLVGGGARPRPGEVSLATRGVLFLDELPEFRRDALEALRQPLEEGVVSVVRVGAKVTFPARVALVAAMNPCPCGHLGSGPGRCRCSPLEVRRYLAKLSGPLLDRFDLAVDVPPVPLATLRRRSAGEPSAAVRGRVVAARDRQRRRGTAACNARLGARDLERLAPLSGPAGEAMIAACERLGLSARGLERVRRVARTLADLDGADRVEVVHAREAVQFRAPLDRRRER